MEVYYTIVCIEKLSGSYYMHRKVYDDKEKAINTAVWMAHNNDNLETYVRNFTVPFRYDMEGA